MIRFKDIIGALDDHKQIQVYSDDGAVQTKSKEEWLNDDRINSMFAVKIKDRPTDRYISVEIIK